MLTITPEQLKARLDRGENLILIDVREDDEVAGGMIPGALHIPMNDIPAKQSELSPEDEIIFICRSGARSGRVCDYLESNGFKGATNLSGGMLEWVTL